MKKFLTSQTSIPTWMILFIWIISILSTVYTLYRENQAKQQTTKEHTVNFCSTYFRYECEDFVAARRKKEMKADCENRGGKYNSRVNWCSPPSSEEAEDKTGFMEHSNSYVDDLLKCEKNYISNIFADDAEGLIRSKQDNTVVRVPVDKCIAQAESARSGREKLMGTGD